jgi:Protein of unknown function (DUF1579)
MQVRTIALFALTAVLAVNAQDKKPADHSGKKSKTQTSAQAAPGGMMTKQADEMKKALNAMQGTWSTKGVFEKSDFMPEAGTDVGTAVFKPGPGGLSMMQQYQSKGAMGPFKGFGLTWFDPKDQMFHSMWCDSMSPQGCAEAGKGKWDGDKIVLDGKFDMNGQSYDMHSTIGPFNGNTFKYSEEVGANGQLKPSMTITYTKKGPATASATMGDKKPTGKE